MTFLPGPRTAGMTVGQLLLGSQYWGSCSNTVAGLGLSWAQLFCSLDSRIWGCKKDGLTVLAEAFIYLYMSWSESQAFQLVICEHYLNALVVLAGKEWNTWPT